MKTLLGIIRMFQQVNTRNMLIHVMANVVVIVGLLITTAIMTSALLIGGLINAHLALLNHEVHPLLALLYVALGGLAIIAALLAAILWRVNCIKKIPHRLFGPSPIATQVVSTVEAFIAGVMND